MTSPARLGGMQTLLFCARFSLTLDKSRGVWAQSVCRRQGVVYANHFLLVSLAAKTVCFFSNLFQSKSSKSSKCTLAPQPAIRWSRGVLWRARIYSNRQIHLYDCGGWLQCQISRRGKSRGEVHWQVRQWRAKWQRWWNGISGGDTVCRPYLVLEESKTEMDLEWGECKKIRRKKEIVYALIGERRIPKGVSAVVPSFNPPHVADCSTHNSWCWDYLPKQVDEEKLLRQIEQTGLWRRWRRLPVLQW